MAHQVETMAWTNEVPWHGLGVKVGKISPEAMCKAAGLDWTVSKQPMFWASADFACEVTEKKQIKTTISSSRLVNGAFALVRSKDSRVLDVVGPDYQPRQNHEVLSFFKEFTDAGKATMETAGSLRNGEIIWALANLNDSFTLKGRDQVKGYLLAVSYHRQGKANLYKTTAVRVVCANTLAMSLSEGGGFKDYHSTKFDEQQISRAKDALGLAREQLHEFEAAATQLMSLKLTQADAIKVFAETFDPPEVEVAASAFWKEYVSDFDKRASTSVKQIMKAYTDAPGATPGNGWGVLNAVTYYCDHMASRTADRRLTNAWFGKTARQKEAVFVTLKEMAS